MDKYLIKAIVMAIAVLLTVSIASANGMQGESSPSGGQPHNPSPDGGKGGISGDSPWPNHNPSPNGGKGGIGGDVSF